jgi:hypothetical protein
MATTIKLKSSATPGTPPTTANLDLRELAMNVGDGKLYLKQRPNPAITDGSGDVIVDLHQRSVTEAVSDALALAIALG